MSAGVRDPAPAAEPTVRLEPLFSREALAGIRDEWEQVACEGGNVFGTPEFLLAWWARFGGDRPLRAFALRDGSSALLGLLPLYEWASRPARVLRFIGHGAGDELGPIAPAAVRPLVADAVGEALARGGASLLVAEQLPEDAGWGSLLGGKRITREGYPVLRLGGRSWEDYLATRSANLRQQVRRLERRLGRDHRLRFVAPESASELESGLDVLFALHRARWGEVESNFSRLEDFHREFARAAWERGWARLWLLEIDGSPAAAWYGLRYAGAECYYQMGRDPAWDRASVGFVLLVHSIREAFADGLDEYRFLRGGESYKYRFTGDDGGLESFVAGRGPVGGALVAAAAPLLAARRALRDRRR
jgi:CelD/BcsL family acetyltransferase involved in cellulose biosynthesis